MVLERSLAVSCGLMSGDNRIGWNVVTHTFLQGHKVPIRLHPGLEVVLYLVVAAPHDELQEFCACHSRGLPERPAQPPKGIIPPILLASLTKNPLPTLVYPNWIVVHLMSLRAYSNRAPRNCGKVITKRKGSTAST